MLSNVNEHKVQVVSRNDVFMYAIQLRTMFAWRRRMQCMVFILQTSVFDDVFHRVVPAPMVRGIEDTQVDLLS